MTTQDILTLAKAGFSATQIGAIMQIQTPVVPVAPVVPVVPVTPVAPVVPVTPVATVDPIMAQLEKLTGVLQANALLNTNMPQTQQTADDILASIINPPDLGKK